MKLIVNVPIIEMVHIPLPHADRLAGSLANTAASGDVRDMRTYALGVVTQTLSDRQCPPTHYSLSLLIKTILNPFR
jgi:hypothetical protein